MSFPPEHEIYRRRMGRNLGLGITLIVFVGLVFALTVVKVKEAGPVAAMAHSNDAPGLAEPKP